MTSRSPMVVYSRARNALERAGPQQVLTGVWSGFWMSLAHLPILGRIASELAAWGIPPYYGRHRLAGLSAHGYRAPNARIHHRRLRVGPHGFIGERVIIYRDHGGGDVRLGDNVVLENDVCIQTGSRGTVTLGDGTHVQPRCQFSGYVGSINIGRNVQIAPNCGFYPYDHGILAGSPIHRQPLESKGGITIEDDAWLGYGVIVLSDVTIERGAVIGAGSVVTRDVPAESVAVGNPARVIGTRGTNGFIPLVPPDPGCPSEANEAST